MALHGGLSWKVLRVRKPERLKRWIGEGIGGRCLGIRPCSAAPFRQRNAWPRAPSAGPDRKSTRLNSSHSQIPNAAFCLKKKKENNNTNKNNHIRGVDEYIHLNEPKHMTIELSHHLTIHI